jgi:Na+-transporting NADH:ubiquinone oxidoreductase subunit C
MKINKESNLYTLVYSVIIVVIVAVMLAYTSEALHPLQARNEANDKIRQILTSLNIESTHANAEQLFNQYIVDSYLVNSQGDKVQGDAFKAELAEELRKPVAERNYPVFEALIEGNKKYILSMHGTGLWGPIWGFISLDDDKNTVYGASFDHEGETPGLGAEISLPPFGHEFIGKKFFNGEKKFTSIAVVKAGHTAHGQDYVDGISGGTITSQAVDAMLKSSIGAYETFLRK